MILGMGISMIKKIMVSTCTVVMNQTLICQSKRVKIDKIRD